MKTVQPQYNCPQQKLYKASRIALNNCIENIDVLASGTNKFKASCFNEMLGEIDEVEALPGMSFTQEHALLRTSYVRVTAANLINWRILKSYIMDAYPGGMLPSKFNEAGYAYFEKADEGDWNAILSLLNAGSFFISENRYQLAADNNMPADFEKEYNDCVTEWSYLSLQYKDSCTEKNKAADKKVLANNALYQSMIALCEVVKDTMGNDKAFLSKEIFDHLLIAHDNISLAGNEGFVKAA